jgi:hypothetical protein
MTPWGIYNLQIRAKFGPWSDDTKHHPGVVVSRPSGPTADPWCIVLPMSSSAPRGLSQANSVEISGVPGIEGVMWVYCDLPTVVGRTDFGQTTPRATMTSGFRKLIQIRLVSLFNLRPEKLPGE